MKKLKEVKQCRKQRVIQRVKQVMKTISDVDMHKIVKRQMKQCLKK